MNKILFLVALLLSIFTTEQLKAVPDSCLTLVCPNDGVNFNPDFICVDTCKDSPTYNDWYQRGTWTIGFKRFFLRDSNQIVKYGKTANLNDIDSINFPEIYSAYKMLDDRFGEITFIRDYYTCVHYSDSSYYTSPCLNISFNKKNRTKDVELYLNQLPEIRFVRKTNEPVKSNIPASCLTLLWPDNGDSYNPDWIMKDTCKDSPTYGEWFQEGIWLMGMKEYIFIKLIPKAGVAFIEDIDTIKYKSVKDSFQVLEKKFGRIRFFRDLNECNNWSDNFFVKNPCFDIDFPRYNLSKAVFTELNNQPISKVTFLKRQPHPSKVEDINSTELELKPNPCYERLKVINLEKYECKYPKVIIYNYIGEIIHTYDYPVGTNEFEIDVSSFDVGIYFLKINNKLFKFIKLR